MRPRALGRIRNLVQIDPIFVCYYVCYILWRWFLEIRIELTDFLAKSIASYVLSKKEFTCYFCYNDFIFRESFKGFEAIIC